MKQRARKAARHKDTTPSPAPQVADWSPERREEPSTRSSGVELVARPAPMDHMAVYSEIMTGWLSPANDRRWCESTLQRDMFGELGSLEQIPYVAHPEEARWSAESDHRVAFLLDLVDGDTTMNRIADVAPLPILEVLRLLADLVAGGVIGLR